MCVVRRDLQSTEGRIVRRPVSAALQPQNTRCPLRSSAAATTFSALSASFRVEKGPIPVIRSSRSLMSSAPPNVDDSELAACLVLGETVFWAVSRLPNVERRERTRLLRTGAREFDDVDGVSAKRGVSLRRPLPLCHRAQDIALIRPRGAYAIASPPVPNTSQPLPIRWHKVSARRQPPLRYRGMRNPARGRHLFRCTADRAWKG